MRTLRWVLGLCVLVSGLAACKKPDSPTGPTPPTDVISYTALGASDGIGEGSTIRCIPFDSECPGGTGYVYLLKRRLQADGRTVTLNNRSLPGGVLTPAIQALARQIGRDVLTNFVDQQVPFVPTGTTHMTIFAGGNDANTIGQAVRAGAAGGDIRGFIDRQVQQWGTDYEAVIRSIRSRAPNARIVALNLPNLGAAPYVAGATLEERSILQRIAVGLTDRVNALAGQNVLIVDLMCEPRIYVPANFSSDGFHPSDQGYQVIAEVTYPKLASGIASTPASSCAQRTLLPIF